MDDLKELRAGGIEEFLQFIIAEFLVAGRLWLGLERAFTVDDFVDDVLFWFCVFALLAGALVGFFGFRQLMRRKTRIEKIINKAEEAEKRRRAASEAEI